MKRINLVIISNVSINPSINRFSPLLFVKIPRKINRTFFFLIDITKMGGKYNFFQLKKSQLFRFRDAFHRKSMEFLKEIYQRLSE